MKKYISLLMMFVLIIGFSQCAWANCGHPFDQWKDPVLVTAATCTEAAVYKYSCSQCDETNNTTPIGSALGHDWTNATCTAPKTCSRCHSTEGEPLGHDCYLESSTPDGQGNIVNKFQCRNCEYYYTQTEPDPSFPTYYDLTIIPEPQIMGTATGAGRYEKNRVVYAVAVPNPGYDFEGWYDVSGNPVGSSRNLDVTMNSDLTYYARFKDAQPKPTDPPVGKFHVTARSNPQGVAVLGGEGDYDAGATVTLTAPQTSYLGDRAFKCWSIDGVLKYDNPCTFTMPAKAVTATAIYELPTRTFTITYMPGSNAKETTGSTQTKYSGQSADLSFAKFTRDGYVQNGWNTNEAGTGTSYSLGGQYTADADLTLYPTWGRAGYHTLTVTFNENGKDKVHTGAETVTNGRVFTVKDDESATFKFDTVNDIYPYNVILNGVSKGHMDQITVNGQAKDQTLYIDFESVYTNPKTGDDSELSLWIAIGILSLTGCAALLPVTAIKHKE